ncbi:unnamed protein product [Gordionus sp. m RMFG-2023]|uniref:receptor expression-enhancing protein 5-like n=1 Tax=Gordionus sp. m RMFG-2023 TaxID=3053472 RepID=UPI0030E0FB10
MEKVIEKMPPLFKDKIEPAWRNLDKSLNQKNFATNILSKVEDTTKINRKYILLGLVIFIALYLMFGYGAHLLCNLLGFAYPAYASFKAIESKNKEDDTQWLAYWVVFAVFSLIESFADLILSWVPFYYLAKCLVLIYLYHPTTFGARVLYKKFIRPYMLKYQGAVDTAMNKANKLAEKITEDTRTNVVSSYTDGLVHEIRSKGD